MPSSSSKEFCVPLTLFAAGRILLICNVEEAGQFLLKNLEQNDSKLWRFALKCCVVSGFGAASIEEVRMAFVAATKNAGYQVFDERVH